MSLGDQKSVSQKAKTPAKNTFKAPINSRKATWHNVIIINALLAGNSLKMWLRFMCKEEMRFVNKTNTYVLGDLCLFYGPHD